MFMNQREMNFWRYQYKYENLFYFVNAPQLVIDTFGNSRFTYLVDISILQNKKVKEIRNL